MVVTNPHKFWLNVKATVFLLFMGVLLSLPFILGNQVPFDTGLLTTNQALSTADYHQIDQAYTTYPSYAFMVEASQSDESLLWNPNAHMGTPFLAAWTTRCFSPFSLPFYFMSLSAGLALSVLLKLWVAGLAAFYTTRKLGYSALLSVLCAVGFQCSHVFLAQATAPFSDALPWVPFLFLFAERMYLRQARYWPVGALTLGLMLLSGDWVATLACLIVFTLYVVIHELMYSHGKGYFLTVCGFLLSIVVGVCLITQQLLPYLQYLQDTIPIAASTKALPGIIDATLLLVPHTGGVRHFGVLHVGILQFLTTLLWLIMRPSLQEFHRSKIDALQVTSVLLIVSTLVYGHFYSDTAIASLVSHHHLLMPLSFMMSLSTVITLAIWSELTPEQCASTIKLATIPVLGTLAGLALPASALLFNSPDPTLSAVFILASTAVIVISYFLLLFYSLVHPKSNMLTASFVVLTILDLSIMAQFNQYRSPAFTLDHERAMSIAQSQQTTGRSLAHVSAFMREAESRPELFNLMPTADLLIPLNQLEQPLSPTFRQSLQLQSVSTEGVAQFQKLHQTPLLQLHDTVVYQEHWTPDTLRSDTIPVLSEKVSLAEWEKAPPAPEWAGAPENIKLRIRVAPTAPSVLAVHRILNDDWVATIDGEVTNTFRVNGIFTGVVVSKGDELIRIAYRPESFKLGKIISVVALVLVIIGYIQLAYYRIRTTKKHH